MRDFSLVPLSGLLLLAAACGSSTPESDGQVNSREDVQLLFEAIVPDLVAALTELANQQPLAASALSSSTDKQTGETSSVQCAGGGMLDVDLVTGQATLTNCSAGGVTISASLALFVFPTGPSSYQANFNGPLTVSGSFSGTIEVVEAFVQWTDPATEANTLWNVMVFVNGQTFTVAGGGHGALHCDFYDPPGGPNSGPPGTACDEDSDCQSNSCRDPQINSSEGCTCRNPDCPPVDVSPGSVGFGGACDDSVDCEGGLPCIDCECI